VTGLFLLAELADLATREWPGHFEANQIVNALGDAAVPAKLALIIGVVFIAWALRRAGDPRFVRLRPYRLASANLLLAWGIGIGLLGTATNVL
jgi:hypothetical protein